MIRRPPRSTLFPYTTLFRSKGRAFPHIRRRSRDLNSVPTFAARSPLLFFAGPISHLRNLRSEEHTSELQSHHDLVCRLLLEKKKKTETTTTESKTSSTRTV